MAAQRIDVCANEAHFQESSDPRAGAARSQYNDIMSRLEKAGQARPTGRLYHICFGEGTALQVFDVWDSQANFDKFGETLMPILGEVGVNAGQPMIEPVQNTVGQ